MRQWFRDIFHVVATVIKALWASMHYWISTYNPRRRTFTERFEYPELPVTVSPRYRGFHRYNLGVCTACGLCARACPVDCIYVGREKATDRKGFQVTSFTIDYTKCLFCALCTEGCQTAGLLMGSSHDLSCYSREGCMVDFLRIPPEVAWDATALNPTVVAQSKAIARPVFEPAA